MAEGGREAVAIVGGGSIGVAWALVFARAGLRVRVAEPDSGRRAAIPRELIEELDELQAAGLLDESSARVAAGVDVVGDIAEAVCDAAYVQECAPERTEVKLDVLARIEAAAPVGIPVASSSSAMTSSSIAANFATRSRMLVVHPLNPPHLIPVVEVVPAPFTEDRVVAETLELLHHSGMAPVRVRQEVEGFVVNRLQGALLREAYCLVRDGVVTAADIDRCVRDGLGPRWAFAGPFETADLNTRGGITAHAERLGPAYARMGADRGQHDPWTPELVAGVEADLRSRLPLSEWESRVSLRRHELAALQGLKSRFRDRRPEAIIPPNDEGDHL